MAGQQRGTRHVPVDAAVDELTVLVKALRQDLISQRRFLDQVLAEVRKNQGAIMAKLEDVLTDLEAQKTVEDGLVALVEKYKEQIDAAAGDQAKIDQIHAWFVSRKAELTDKLLANTPQAPAGGSSPKKGKARKK